MTVKLFGWKCAIPINFTYKDSSLPINPYSNMYSEMSYYFPDSLCSGAHCNRAGSEKLVWLSGGLVCSATSDLHRKTSRLCKDVLRRALLWRYTVRGCCRKGNTSRSVNHVHQCLHDMTDRGCTVLLTFIRVSPRPTCFSLLTDLQMNTQTLRLQGIYLLHQWTKIIQGLNLQENFESWQVKHTSENKIMPNKKKNDLITGSVM